MSLINYPSTRIYVISILLLLSFNFSCQDKQSDFESINTSDEWNLIFHDQCTFDWTEKWTLDGLVATVENTKEGMHFSAGPEAKNDAHHAVLWTKESFAGDIKIEYDYIRTDSATKFVTILYIQATGNDEHEFAKDISKWSKFRQVPAMRKYFEHMNLLHISYAAFGNQDDGLYYVRARRYPKPEDKGFNITGIEPSYDYEGYVKSGENYHITAIKSGNTLYFKMENSAGEELFTWDISDIDAVTEGRIGLRHMYTRSATYKNFKVFTKK